MNNQKLFSAKSLDKGELLGLLAVAFKDSGLSEQDPVWIGILAEAGHVGSDVEQHNAYKVEWEGDPTVPSCKIGDYLITGISGAFVEGVGSASGMGKHNIGRYLKLKDDGSKHSMLIVVWAEGQQPNGVSV